MIELNKVTFTYNGAKTVNLKAVSLHIKKGECVVLTGDSGSGKTTVTRLINALIPNFYEGELSGEVKVHGQDIRAYSPHKLSQLVGSVFQNPRTQFFNTDTDSELVFGMENMGFSYEVMKQRYQETVAELDLFRLKDRDVFKLSGGEKQLIAIGSVYALGPDIYVLDEPSASLDSQAIEKLSETIRLLKKQGKTILIAEHRLYYLREIADRVIRMKAGKVEKEWSAGELAAKKAAELAADGLRSFEPTKLREHAPFTGGGTTSLQVQGLTVCHERKKAVFRNLTFAASKGEVLGIAGANGWGKTTLARTLCGLKKEKQGSICIGGKKSAWRKRREQVYLVMQDPNYQLFSESVKQELQLSVKASPDKEEIEEVLAALSLTHLAEQHPLSLSGGQKQRVCIALAALSTAEVIIFDEPTSGLDYSNMCAVAKMLSMLAKRGKTILVISHDYELLNLVCDRVMVF